MEGLVFYTDDSKGLKLRDEGEKVNNTLPIALAVSFLNAVLYFFLIGGKLISLCMYV